MRLTLLADRNRARVGVRRVTGTGEQEQGRTWDNSLRRHKSLTSIHHACVRACARDAGRPPGSGVFPRKTPRRGFTHGLLRDQQAIARNARSTKTKAACVVYASYIGHSASTADGYTASCASPTGGASWRNGERRVGGRDIIRLGVRVDRGEEKRARREEVAHKGQLCDKRTNAGTKAWGGRGGEGRGGTGRGGDGSALESCAWQETRTRQQMVIIRGGSHAGDPYQATMQEARARARVRVRVYSTRLRIRAGRRRAAEASFSSLCPSPPSYRRRGGESRRAPRVLPSEEKPALGSRSPDKSPSPRHVVIYVIFERDVSARNASSRFRFVPLADSASATTVKFQSARARLVSGAKFFRTGACRYLSAGVSLERPFQREFLPFRGISERRASVGGVSSSALAPGDRTPLRGVGDCRAAIAHREQQLSLVRPLRNLTTSGVVPWFE